MAASKSNPVGRRSTSPSPHRGQTWLPVLFVACAAVVMGLPTLGGSFVGGDDHRLALNHVLVNHPSFEHAVKLFTIWHRDLYQPLPLLSFQLEFAVANLFGLFDRGIEGGAWLFHLTNILIHAANAVLVFMVVRRLHERIAPTTPIPETGLPSRDGPVDRVNGLSLAVATTAALFFAVHPLQTEVVAWTNGRMMLLSTLFALLALKSFIDWLDRPRPVAAVLVVLFVLFSAISKIRIGLPVLLAIVVVARRANVNRRTVGLWLVASIVTGVFVVVNYLATANAELFSEAAEHLQGPRVVRVILALGSYFRQMVWPAGLASYYPTPPLVSWSDRETLTATLIVVPAIAFLAWACLRSRAACLGVLWFVAEITVTLPFVPARNVLSADRYMYLPIIGLLWLLAELAVRTYQGMTARPSLARVKLAMPLAGVAATIACIAVCWHVARFYATPLLKTERIAELFPDSPRVWERLGWSYQGEGDYDKAIECAQRALTQEAVVGRGGAYQLWGTTELKLGHPEEALRLLAKAIEVDPKSGVALSRLGGAYEELGRDAEAAVYYERAVSLAPLHNPTIVRLAGTYRRLGRIDDARATYDKALSNNPYDVHATLGRAELGIDSGTPDGLRDAEARLVQLLDWMPENTAAQTNLGVVLQKLGRVPEAVAAYEDVLRREPNELTANLNLGEIHRAAGRVDAAQPLFDRAAASDALSVPQAVTVHEFFIAREVPRRAVLLWGRMVERHPDVPGARVFLAWANALAGESAALKYAETLRNQGQREPLLTATIAYAHLSAGEFDAAMREADMLARMGAEAADARQRTLDALERFDAKAPNVPWTFCMTARLLVAERKLDVARAFIGLCEERCADDACRADVAILRGRLAEHAPPPPVP